MSIIGHELFHNLQNAWIRHDAVTRVGAWNVTPATRMRAFISDLGFREPGPSSIESNWCITDRGYAPQQLDGAALVDGIDPYGHDPDDVCVSTRKLGATDGLTNGFNRFDRFYANPGMAMLSQPYSGVVFWRYVEEQFARPLGDSAHPAVVEFALREAPERYVPLGAWSRESDEGSDLLGGAFEAFAADLAADSNARARPTRVVLDELFQDWIGRSFDALTLDMHTAVLLDGYEDIDPADPAGTTYVEPRWRFEWVGDYNAVPQPPPPLVPGVNRPGHPNGLLGGEAPLERPFEVPADLREYPGGGGSNGWGFRASRVLDSWAPGPVKDELQLGEVRDSLAPTTLAAHGAAYLSVQPVLGYGDLEVELRLGPGGRPRFRVFTVTNGTWRAASPHAYNPPRLHQDCAWVPVAGTSGFSDAEQCRPRNGVVRVTIPVPNVGDADANMAPILDFEVLVVASAVDRPGSFHWRFGPPEAGRRLHIAQPTFSQPADAGEGCGALGVPCPPGVAPEARKRGVELVVVAVEGVDQRVPGLADRLEVAIEGMPVPADFAEVGVGTYWAVVHAPDALYPLVGEFHADLSVTWNAPGLVVASAVEPDSLRLHAFGHPQPPRLTTLVLDSSGSMDGPKEQALRRVGEIPIHAARDDDSLGIVTFSTHATTLLPVLPLSSDEDFNLVPHRDEGLLIISAFDDEAGDTSIGDGVVQAQVELDTAAPTDGLHRMMLLTDGIQNVPLDPIAYYDRRQADQISDDVDHNWPEIDLNWHDRQGSRSVPQISAMAIGIADFEHLGALALVTGGIVTHVPFENPPVEIDLDLADMMTATFGEGQRTERRQAFRGYGMGAWEMPMLEVELDTVEMLVTVYSAPDGWGADNLRLVDPLGALLAPVSASDHVAVFRVDSPEPGWWSFDYDGVAPPPDWAQESVFVEHAVNHPVQLYVRADNERATGALPDAPPTGYVTGDSVILRAVLHGDGLEGPYVSAEIERPDGATDWVFLWDDGSGADWNPNDRIFTARYARTELAGAYQVRLTASAWSAVWANVERSRHQAFFLQDAPDGDGDGMADWWELEHGLQVSVGDATGDPDQDGAVNYDEYLAGTDPNSDDTDGGGESDGTEIAHWREPHESLDDLLQPPPLHVYPADGAVILQPDARGVLDVEIAASPDAAGPFVTVFDGPLPLDGLVEEAAANDTPRCYRARARDVGQNADSAWSGVHCVVPALDPYPPTVEVQIGEQGDGLVPSSEVMVSVDAWDDPLEPPTDGETTARARSDSGVTEVVWAEYGAFAAAQWLPIAPVVGVDLVGWTPLAAGAGESTELSFKVRDAAGNESLPHTLRLVRPAETDLDAALRDLDDARTALSSAPPDLVAAGVALDAAALDLAAAVGEANSWVGDPEWGEPGAAWSAELQAVAARAVAAEAGLAGSGRQALSDVRSAIRGAASVWRRSQDVGRRL